MERLGRIPGFSRRYETLRSRWDDPRLPFRCRSEKAPRALLAYAAGLAEMVAGLEEQVGALRKQLEEIGTKADVARAAELSWHPKVTLPDRVVFGNLAGEVADLPISFVKVYQARSCLHVTAIVAEGDRILVKEGDELIASIPKTLWVTLERVLDATTLPEDLR